MWFMTSSHGERAGVRASVSPSFLQFWPSQRNWKIHAEDESAATRKETTTLE